MRVFLREEEEVVHVEVVVVVVMVGSIGGSGDKFQNMLGTIIIQTYTLL